jgi:hypothetical protein
MEKGKFILMLAGYHFLKDKFRPVLQKLERKRRVLKLSDFLYYSIFVKLFSKISQQLLLNV